MTHNRPGTRTGTSTTTKTGTGSKRSTLPTAEVHAKQSVADWYAEPEPEGEDLSPTMEENGGVSDDDVPDGILDAWDDDSAEFPREPDPERRPTKRAPMPHIVFWRSSDTLGWEIPPIPASMTEDPLLLHVAVAHAERLEKLAAALASLQRETLLALSSVEAVRRLQTLSKIRLAEEAGVEAQTGSKISRDRFMAIETPMYGLVPIDLFTWAGADPWSQRVDAVRHADEMLRNDPDMTANALGSAIAEEFPVTTDWIRKLVPSLRDVHGQPGIVARHRRAFPRTSWQDLRRDLGRSGDNRAKPVMCLALVGGIGNQPTIGEPE